MKIKEFLDELAKLNLPIDKDIEVLGLCMCDMVNKVVDIEYDKKNNQIIIDCIPYIHP